MMWTDRQISDMRARLLDWYDREGRSLPWRVRPEERADGAVPDPYAIWLSEIMMQQTTIPHGTPYWHKFLSLYPTVHDLAEAPLDDVLTHWAGLGYYARARNLHKCARMIVDEYDGVFPQTKAALLKLPGIGDYTASTLAAICFDETESIVDGNVERVITRLHRVQTPLPKAKTEIRRLAAVLADLERPGDYGQALMDLGATLCTPKNPACNLCPWSDWCGAHEQGDEIRYPLKTPKKMTPIRRGHAFIMQRDNAVWLRRRAEEGLLGGMMEVPGSDWEAELPPLIYPIEGDWSRSAAPVRHVFTHFTLELDVHVTQIETDPPLKGRWVATQSLHTQAIPSLFKKVLDRVKPK